MPGNRSRDARPIPTTSNPASSIPSDGNGSEGRADRRPRGTVPIIGSMRKTLVLVGLAFVAASPVARGAERYDPGSVETVSGEVASVERQAQPGGPRGVHVLLRTDAGDVFSVALGPMWVVDPYRLRVGDRVDVTGWRVVRGKRAMVAAEVKRGDRVMRLRNREGAPLWRRPARR